MGLHKRFPLQMATPGRASPGGPRRNICTSQGPAVDEGVGSFVLWRSLVGSFWTAYFYYHDCRSHLSLCYLVASILAP